MTTRAPQPKVLISSSQKSLRVPRKRIAELVAFVAQAEGVRVTEIDLAVVRSDEIARLNRRFLGRRGLTDVLSFELERAGERLEAEVVVSADTAHETASRFGWAPADELLLYVIHGTLHLVGSNDQTPDERARMQARERVYLARFGLEPPYDGPVGREPGPAASSSSAASGGGEKIP